MVVACSSQFYGGAEAADRAALHPHTLGITESCLWPSRSAGNFPVNQSQSLTPVGSKGDEPNFTQPALNLACSELMPTDSALRDCLLYLCPMKNPVYAQHLQSHVRADRKNQGIFWGGTGFPTLPCSLRGQLGLRQALNKKRSLQRNNFLTTTRPTEPQPWAPAGAMHPPLGPPIDFGCLMLTEVRMEASCCM